MAHKTEGSMKSRSSTQRTSSLQIPKKSNPLPPDAGPSAPRSTSIAQKVPTVPSYDKDLFSGTESEMTEEEQLDFATPVSSRSETPPAANINDLNRCVTIMQQISVQDVALLKELAGVREIAAKLRKRARDVRDLVKAESGRRERMETYFRYWQEIEPNWDRKWLYGEKTEPEKMDLNTAPPVPGKKPMLSPEEVKRKRMEIISKQEAERQQLEAWWRREMRDRNLRREESNQVADDRSIGGAAPLSTVAEESNVDESDDSHRIEHLDNRNPGSSP